MSELFQVGINVIIQAALFGLVAASFTLIYRVTGVLNLAHGSIVIFAAYVFSRGLHAGLPVIGAGFFALLAVVLLGFLMHTVVFEPLRRGRHASMMGSVIASIALLLFLAAGMLLLFGSRTESLDTFRQAPFEFGTVTFTAYEVWMTLIALIAIGTLGSLVRWTRLGKAMRAVADNAEVAAIVGIPPARVRLYTFMIGAGFAGLAGILYAGAYSFESNTSVSVAIIAFTRAVVGGIGSIPGALFGSFLVEIVENIWGWFGTAALRSIGGLLVTLIVLLWRPRGLLGRKTL